MDVLPAIDIRGGRCVRLLQGRYDDETTYGDDPVAQAREFIAQGTTWIHVVDLDAARTGSAANRELVGAIARLGGAEVECGGGVRTDADADALWEAGVARVVVGTKAVEDPEWVTGLARRGRVAVGLDARGRDVAVHGWETATGADLLELARRFGDAGVDAVIVTEIGRDGTLEGPDLDQLASVLEVTSAAVIASGGVGTLADLDALAELEAGGRRLTGAICGKALYEGRFDVASAVARLGGTR